MPGRVLLDTSVIVSLLRGDEAVAARLEDADEVFTSIIACNRLSAEVYSRLKHRLREKGRPIPDNDLWVAATAVQYGLALASRDEHFDEIDELEHET